MVRAIFKDVETRQQRHDKNSALQSSIRGISGGYDPLMSDVSMPVRKCWDSITESSIARYWMK